jgi:putative ABC transport system ATP-binding protein
MDVLDALGVGARALNMPTQLSGGEQQRVTIARAPADSPY